MTWWPYVVLLVLLGAMALFSQRNRRRQAAEEAERVSRIGVGTEVMTTSGLYGTVVARHDDGTVLLSIAPGVEVKWVAAALRDAASLADNYRRGLGDEDAAGGDPAGSAGGGQLGGQRGGAADGSSVELRKNGDPDTPS